MLRGLVASGDQVDMEVLLLCGLVESDGHPIDGLETYRWTALSDELLRALREADCEVRKMKVKSGAVAHGLHDAMRLVFIEAEKIWSDLGEDLVVTSGMDGERQARSLHWFGRAVDFRTRRWGMQWGSTKRALVVHRLREALGLDYDIIGESDHIHCEYDPK